MSNPIRLAMLFGVSLLWSTGTHSEQFTIPLLVPPDTSGMTQGILRIANATDDSGTVEIFAIDDTGTRSGPATFTLSPLAAMELSAGDLQSGNAAKGLSGGTGSGSGDVRLLIDTELEIVPMAFFRAADGTLSTMHQTVRGAAPASGQYRYEVPIFNPSTEVTQESRLRLINPGDAAAAVTISGRDDTGAPGSGGDVTLTVAAGGATTLTARQLEAGDSGITGQLGAGTGRWRLTAVSDQPLRVVNLVAASAGYWNNLSTTAVAGTAPADHSALSERFVGESVVYETDSGRFTLNAMDGSRFTETGETDGFTTAYTGGYRYAAIGPDAGRLMLDYDGGDACRANFYFSSRTSGWFASYCTGSDDPDGYRLSGDWFMEEAEGGDGEVVGYLGDCYVGLTVGIGQSCTYPGTTDEFSVNERGRGRLLDRLAGIRIRIDNEPINGRVYDLEASHQSEGVWRIDRLAGSSMAPGENLAPSFAEGSGPGLRTYTVDTAIDTLTLPAARGGDGALTHSLSPDVPGLMFDGATRQLSGTPTTVGTYDMTFTAADEDGDTAALNFRIVVGTVSGTITRCSGVPAATGIPNYRITIEGFVSAHSAISNVTVTGYGNGVLVGTASLGAIAAGDAGDFSITGIISTALATLGCTVDIEYSIVGAQGDTSLTGVLRRLR